MTDLIPGSPVSNYICCMARLGLAVERATDETVGSLASKAWVTLPTERGDVE